jgi:hypothetical protein
MRVISTRMAMLALAGLALAACGSDSGIETGSVGSGGTIGGGSSGGGSGGGSGGTVHPSGSTADHSAAAAFDGIPEAAVQDAESTLRIFYGHTSHGSQLLTGLEMLQGEGFGGAPSIDEDDSDLGTGGGSDWGDATRSALAQGDYNVVMWSWCGGASEASADDIDTYLATMNDLEREYPNVKFVYMTGHTDGSGADGTLRVNNQRIRSYCAQNGKWLFDFENIESYDPANNYYPDTDDSCPWCETWCEENGCPDVIDDVTCAHSPDGGDGPVESRFNCYLKGKALWWLLARMAGWSS